MAKELLWTVHLVKRNPKKGIAVFIFVMVVSYFTGVTSGSVYMSLLALIILSISVSQYFLPTTFHFTEDSVRIETLFQKKERKWNNFKRWETNKKTIKLYTMTSESRLDNYRAWLILPERNFDEIVDFIKGKIL